MKITPLHWLAFGMFLTGLATQISSLNNWHAAVTPGFVSGVVMNVGSIIVAAASGKLFPNNLGQK